MKSPNSGVSQGEEQGELLRLESSTRGLTLRVIILCKLPCDGRNLIINYRHYRKYEKITDKPKMKKTHINFKKWV